MQVIANGNAHGGLLRTVFAYGCTGLEADVLESSVAQVLVEELRRGIVGDVNVRAPGVVEVGPNHAETVVAVGIADSGGFGNVSERSVSIVVKERIARAFQAAWAALHVDATILAVGRFAEAGKIVEMKIDVVRDHQIEEAVSVVVAKRRARGPAAIGNAGFGGDISESAVAIVVIKDIAAETSEIQIRPAVVVIVAHGSAHGKTARVQAGLFGDIGECAVAIIVIKGAGSFLALQSHLDAGSVGEINVRPAIAVVVDNNHSTAHGFDDVFFRGIGSVLEGNSGFCGDVFQLRNRAAAALGGLCTGRRR